MCRRGQYRGAVMHYASRTSLALVAVALAGCGINNTTFREEFPDPAVLITTTDPMTVRDKLARVRLPESRDHTEQLLAMLRSCESIDAAHLVLLTRAVPLPQNIQIHNNSGRWTYPQRGKADNSAFVDQLLTEGADKVRDIDAYWLGEMIGISQSDPTMLMLCNRFVPQVDDRSDRAFDEMVRGMPGSPAFMPFLSKYMGPEGRLDGDRGWRAFSRMSFDSSRLILLDILLKDEHEITEDRLLMAMKAFSFDSGRTSAFNLLVDKARPISPGAAHAAIATFSFDSGRRSAFATLAKPGNIVLGEQDLLRFVKLFSFDSGRITVVKQFANSLEQEPTEAGAVALLKSFSFDSDRTKALKLMANRWRNLPADARRRIAKTFSFDSGRSKALELLMR